MVSNGKSGYQVKVFNMTCDFCGEDKGYHRKRASKLPCRFCSNTLKYLHKNIDFTDYKLHGNYRIYRTRCLVCNIDKGYHRQCHGEKLCHSCAMKLKWKKGYMVNIQKGAKHNYPYKDVILRSSYELAYAKWLDIKGIKWEYEPHFELSNGSNYYPDFKLEDGTIVEIKGYFRDDAKIKWEMFNSEYPNIKKVLLMKTELKELGVL